MISSSLLSFLISCSDPACLYHIPMLDTLCSSLLRCISQAAILTLPAANIFNRCMPGWNDAARQLKSKARFWHKVWCEAGSSSAGVLHQLKIEIYTANGRNTIYRRIPCSSPLWVWLGGIWPTRSKLDTFGWSYWSMIVALATVMECLEYLWYFYTQSMAGILYTAESLAVLCLWVWLGGIRPTRSKLDTFGWSYWSMIVALATVMEFLEYL